MIQRASKISCFVTFCIIKGKPSPGAYGFLLNSSWVWHFVIIETFANGLTISQINDHVCWIVSFTFTYIWRWAKWLILLRSSEKLQGLYCNPMICGLCQGYFTHIWWFIDPNISSTDFLQSLLPIWKPLLCRMNLTSVLDHFYLVNGSRIS